MNWAQTKVKLSDLKPWGRNPKSISKEHANRLLSLWQELNQFQTVAIGPAGEVYDGHQRLSVLMAAYGRDYEVMALQSDTALTEKQREKLVIAAHTGTTGEFDWDQLSGWDAKDLVDWGLDAGTLKDWKRDVTALDTMLKSEQEEPQDVEPQIDKAEELRIKWGVETGQLWQLGEHRLICGDCTDPEVVDRVMEGEKADTLVSDPPYGIGYEYADHNDTNNEENQNLVMAAWEHAPSAKVWSCGLMNLQRDLAWNPGAKVLCWHKGFAQAGNGLGGASTWEPFIAVNIKGGTLPNDYLHFGTDRIEGLRDLHSCPKPIKLFEHLIEHLAGDMVYEPFSGSGTTLIACENLHRKCRAVEISPAYVAVAIQRWVDLTGGEPVLL